MPFFDYTQYNFTSAPIPSIKNSITSTATDFGFRDFLLLKNLNPRYPQALNLSPGQVRIGEPVLDTSINNNSNVPALGLPLEVEGLFRYDIAILPNRFKNEDPSSPIALDIEDIPQTQGVFGPIQFPQGTQSYPTAPTQVIKDLGLFGKTEYANFRSNNTLFNLYLDESKQKDVSDYISLQPILTSTQLTSYLDEYGNLNTNNNRRARISDIVGSFLNGQGVGVSTDGVVSNFDIRASLAGRVLGASGVINDTKLGNIGAQQLALALANNAAFNIQQDLLGVFNVKDNILEIVRGDADISFRPNYQITVSSSELGKAADYTARILGFTLPRSYLNAEGSIFLSESNSANIERANSMILNTGRGQVKALINNVTANINGTTEFDRPDLTPFRSGYAPGYKKNNGREAINPNLYAFYNSDKSSIYNFVVFNPDNIIPEISYNRDKMISNYGFITPEETFSGPRGNNGYDNRKISDVGFTWTTSKGGLTNSNSENEDCELPLDDQDKDLKKSLLTKTQKLFNSKGMKNIVTSKGDMGHKSSQIQTANANGLSKGSAVLSPMNFSVDGEYKGVENATADQVYCRSWTTLNRYEYVNNLIRHRGIDDNKPHRFQTNGSVLDDNGFVKISPYTTDKEDDIKKYMFSIENLAWSDNTANLMPCEIGSGDLISGKKGRIMWFPPYNIQINESTSVDWESTKFIGRGESVYTYNNTERSGTINFSIIVDHPSYVNNFRKSKADDNFIASFFAGCVDKLTVSEINDITADTVMIPQQKTTTKEPEPPSFEIYYPNDEDSVDSIISTGYENGLMNNSISPTQSIDYSNNPNGVGFGIGTYVGGFTSNTPWSDTTNYGLNGFRNSITLDGEQYSGWTDSSFINALNNYLLTKCPNCVVTITSYASIQGVSDINEKLADARTKSLYDYLYPKLFTGKDDNYKRERIRKSTNNEEITNSSCTKDSFPDSEACKKDRKSKVSFQFNPNLQASSIAQPEPVTNNARSINNEIKNRLYSECDYFDKLTEVDKFVFDRFRDKIKHFHPAFHSTTPEGLNSRLTFLQQCTRQGPTNENKGATNLAFGRAPVCILRVGDFFNTKVVFDSINIDYEPIVWDLNPEGVGVQPMIANVTLSFKFLGGSSLLGPINRLQNALSFNYYANTQVYDPRADYIATKKQIGELVKNNPNADKTIQSSIDGNYGIVAGIKDINKYMTKENTNNQSLTNQILANNTITTNPAPVSPPVGPNSSSGSDFDRIKFVNSTISYTPEESVSCVFEISGGNLSKDQTFRAYLTDTINFTYEIGVGSIKAQNNSNTQIIPFNLVKTPNGDLTKNLEDGDDYSIILKFKEGNKTQIFTYVKV